MDESERKKAIELLKEMRQTGGEAVEDLGSQHRLTWMYKGPSDLVDKEEYLLGKAIDKSFEAQRNGDSSEVMGRSYEPSNVPKRLLSKPDSTEQVDIAKKILEDPLYAIKQKELEARRKLLDNPVKLKELKKMVMERNMQKLRKKQEKKKKKKDATKDEKDLDKYILKKLKILSESHRRKLLEEAAESSETSSESDREKMRKKKMKKKKKKKKIMKRKSSSENDSDSGSSDESDDTSRKSKKKRKSDDFVRGKRNDSEDRIKKSHRSRRFESTDTSTQHGKLEMRKSATSRCKGSRNHRTKAKSRSSSSTSNSTSTSSSSSDSCSYSSDSVSSESSSTGDDRKSKKGETCRQGIRGTTKRSENYDKRVLKKSRKSAKDDIREKKQRQKRREKTTGKNKSDSDSLTIVSETEKKGVKEDLEIWERNRSRVDKFSDGRDKRYERNYREKPLVPPSRAEQLSEKEREAKLKEMKENAKARKQDREKNLESHRKRQLEEDKLKDYDDGFMRRQISHATSQGTMADRIRSNVNNIQRSKADMDKSFVRK